MHYVKLTEREYVLLRICMMDSMLPSRFCMATVSKAIEEYNNQELRQGQFADADVFIKECTQNRKSVFAEFDESGICVALLMNANDKPEASHIYIEYVVYGITRYRRFKTYPELFAARAASRKNNHPASQSFVEAVNRYIGEVSK